MNDIDNAVLWMISADRHGIPHTRQQKHRPKMSLAQLAGLANAYVPPEVLRLRRAHKIAAEVRARHPEMQVRKVAP